MRMTTVYIPVITHSRNFGRDLLPLAENHCHINVKNSEPNLNMIISRPFPVPPGSVKCKWSDCGKSFTYLDDLAAHVSAFHSNSGPGGLFYCRWDGCARGNRGFNARYKMLVHVRTHTNEKPHRCFQCQKSFSRAENLKIHARSHTGERPYVCPVPGCGKAYSNSSDRFKHTRTHSVHKPYACKMPSCGKRYTDPSSLRKHVKTYRHFPKFAHSDENSPSKSEMNVPTRPDENCESVMEEAVEKMAVVESTSLPRIVRNTDENGFHFAVLKKWLKSESVFKSLASTSPFGKVEEDQIGFRNSLQVQDFPLDLSIRK